jgi:hypothetical protein
MRPLPGRDQGIVVMTRVEGYMFGAYADRAWFGLLDHRLGHRVHI